MNNHACQTRASEQNNIVFETGNASETDIADKHQALTSDLYQLPDWFLARNVKLVSELQDLGPNEKVCLRGSIAGGEDNARQTNDDRGNASGLDITSELLAELVDMVKAAFVLDEEKQLPTLRTIFLRLLCKSDEEVLEQLLLCLAREMRASLVSVDLDDLEDLGREFYRQEPLKHSNADKLGGLRGNPGMNFAQHYFAMPREHTSSQEQRKLNEKAISTVLKSGNSKTPAASAMEIGLQSQITLVHIRDLLQMDRITSRDNTCGIPRSFLHTVVRRRMAGEAITILASVREFTFGSKVDKISGLDEALSVKVPSVLDSCTDSLEEFGDEDSDFDTDSEEDEREYHDSGLRMKRLERTQALNLRRLKRLLPRPAFDEQALHPFAEWKNLLPGKRKWTEVDLLRAATQITGRSFNGRLLDVDDVRIILTRLNLCKRPKQNAKFVPEDRPAPTRPVPLNNPIVAVQESNTSVPVATEIQDTLDLPPPLVWDERKELIQKGCNEYEKRLIDNIINPEQLDTSLEEVILDKKIKDSVKHLASFSSRKPLRKPDTPLEKLRIKGALLFGPPGTGKTHLTRAVAKESGSTMLAVNASDIDSKWLGDSEKMIKAAFTLAAKFHPSVLFLDEVDALFFRRASDDKPWIRSKLTVFLDEMDGLRQSPEAPFVLAATNRPSDLDPAFHRRLPYRVKFQLPNKEARLRILQLYLTDDNLDPLVDLVGLANATEGYSGSDLKSLCAGALLMSDLEPALEHESSEKYQKLRLSVQHFADYLKGSIDPAQYTRNAAQETLES